MWFTPWHLIILMGKIMELNIFVRDKIVTGSFDRTAKIWDANTG
jgi:WD40 repeat protein